MKPHRIPLLGAGMPPRLVCHCLLIETGNGLVLIDSGFGLQTVADPLRHLGRFFLKFGRPSLDPEETAVRQVVRLGHQPRDVRHIILTHLDLDHAGGVADFPWAILHVHRQERDAAAWRPSFLEHERYKPLQWRDHRNWKTYEDSNDEWFGLRGVRPLDEISPEILLIPLRGHTRGHCAVAVRTGSGWVVHGGDGFIHHREMEGSPPSCPVPLSVFQRVIQVDGPSRISNQARLRNLVRTHPEVRLFSAHDPHYLTARPSEPASD